MQDENNFEQQHSHFSDPESHKNRNAEPEGTMETEPWI